MPIKNKGNFNLSDVVRLQIANDWPTAQVVYTSDILENPSNLYFTDARVVSAVTPLLTAANIANFASTVNTTVQPFLTTANVIETSANLYFTAERVNATVQPFLTTANVIESASNLYFTSARVNATVQPFLTTANVIESASNLYFTNTRVFNAVTIGTITGDIAVTGNLVANGLVIQGINVTQTVLAGNVVSTGTSTSNIIVADSITSNTWNRLYTANVIETSGNLYFTNARVVSALVAGDSITIEANGRISASLEGNDPIPVTVVNSTQRIISTGALSYTLNTSVASPQNIMVVMEGLVQLPYVDYSTSAYTLTLADSPPVGSNIEIRYFGVDTLNSIRSVSTTVDTFVGNGSNVNFTLSITPPNKNFISINIDGVYQQSDTYSLLNKIVTLSEAPVVGANIDIRILSGVGGSAFNTRNYVGTGTANTFALTEGFTKDTILVFENGVAQVPVIDYDVVNDFLVFTTPPAANINIQVREIGVSSIAGGNVIAAIRGFDQYAGNIIPISTLKTLGNSTTKWDKAYLEANGLVLGNTTIGISGSTLTLTTSGTTTVVGADNISPFLLMGA